MSYLNLLDTYTLNYVYDLVWKSHFDAVMRELKQRLNNYSIYMDIVNDVDLSIHRMDVYTRFHYVMEQHRRLREAMGWGFRYLRIHFLELMFELRERCFQRRKRLYYRQRICFEIRQKITRIPKFNKNTNTLSDDEFNPTFNKIFYWYD